MSLQPFSSIVQPSEATLHCNRDEYRDRRYLTKSPLAVQVGISRIPSDLLLKILQSENSPQLAYCNHGCNNEEHNR